MKFMWQYKVGKLPKSFDQEWTCNYNKSDRYDLRNLQEIYNPRTNLVNIDKMTYFNYARIWTEISKDLPSELDEYIFFPSLKKNRSMITRLKKCNVADYYSCKLRKEKNELLALIPEKIE